MITAKARIIYDPRRPGMKSRTNWWCVANVIGGDEICRYYRWWVEKEILNPLNIRVSGSIKKYPFYELHEPSWGAHISVIRGEKPKPNLMHLWKKYHGAIIDVSFDNNVKQATFSLNANDAGKLWYVKAYSDELTNIRKEFGLPFNWPLHMTIGRLA